MNEVKTIVGIQKGMSKTNNPFTILHMVGAFPDYIENKQGTFAENVYCRGNIDVSVGANVLLNYQPGFQGKAVVSGITVVAPDEFGVIQ